MTAKSTGGAVGSGYGSLERSTADATLGSHTHGLPHAERSRSRSKLAAVGAGLIATTVILGTVLLVSTQAPSGNDGDVALPILNLATQGKPSELLSLSAPGSEFRRTRYSHTRHALRTNVYTAHALHMQPSPSLCCCGANLLIVCREQSC